MHFKIDPEFRDRNRPHTVEERRALSIIIEGEGCHADALTVAKINGHHFLADGHTTLEICKEKGLKHTAPRVIVFPDRQSVLDWIDRRQRSRRNLTLEEMQLKRAARIGRVAEARQEGQSTRAIAEAEGGVVEAEAGGGDESSHGQFPFSVNT
jgi:hypothetical protein